MTARESVGLRAVARIQDARAFTSVARSALLEVVRRAALEGIGEADDLLAVAINSEFKDAALTATERLDARAHLEQVAARARNKAAAKPEPASPQPNQDANKTAAKPPLPDPQSTEEPSEAPAEPQRKEPRSAQLLG